MCIGVSYINVFIWSLEFRIGYARFNSFPPIVTCCGWRHTEDFSLSRPFSSSENKNHLFDSVLLRVNPVAAFNGLSMCDFSLISIDSSLNKNKQKGFYMSLFRDRFIREPFLEHYECAVLLSIRVIFASFLPRLLLCFMYFRSFGHPLWTCTHVVNGRAYNKHKQCHMLSHIY